MPVTFHASPSRSASRFCAPDALRDHAARRSGGARLWLAYRNLSDTDLRLLYDYLRSIPAAGPAASGQLYIHSSGNIRCAMTPSDSPNRSTAELVRHYIDQAWNRGHFAVIPEVTAEPYQAGAWNSPRRPFRSLTLKELEGQVADFRSAFPDLVMHVEDILEQGERAYVRTRMTGTQRGAFMGMPATGKAVDVTLCAVYESRGGKLIGHGALVDMMGLMQQLGVAPGPPTAGAPPPAGSSPP